MSSSSRSRHRSSRSSSSGYTLLRWTKDGHLYREPSNEVLEVEAEPQSNIVLYEEPGQLANSLTSHAPRNTNQTPSYQQRALVSSIPSNEHTALAALRHNSTNIDHDLRHILECIKYAYGGSLPSENDKSAFQRFDEVIGRIDAQNAVIANAHTEFYTLYKAGDTALNTRAETLLKILDERNKVRKAEKDEDKLRSMQITQMWTDNAAKLVQACAKITSEIVSVGGGWGA
ncbi:hypothetical protein BDZ45DRAFT_739968 [Acephala macrosclerotiorum]|nr:hypothetical protein BDZ45DRAFT_739968 [Acephala macrosclerotiorum]